MPLTLQTLIDRLEAETGDNNALDVMIEVALFDPANSLATDCRANSAGTKVIYTNSKGEEVTYWADEWTADPSGTIAKIRERMKHV
jgi:hypothetical protein